jgi:hypothetical protein
MTHCQPLPVTAAAGTAAAVSWAGRVMNQVLAHLELEQHPDKTGTCPAKPAGRRRIGRVTRGFDFLGVDFQPGAPLAPSAVSLARKTEKIARLHEQGASPERIGRYRQHWQKWLHRLIGQPPPAGSTPPDATPPPAPPVRSLSYHSPQLRFTQAGCAPRTIQKYDNENEKTGIHRITTLRRGGSRHRGCVRSQRGHGADYFYG